jgi:hypothetical protein
MRGVIITALAATLAIVVFAGTKAASALPAAAAINYSQPNNTGDLVQVKKWYKKKYHYRRPYYRHYRPYRYYRPYYRPYWGPRYYYRPYWYRPGVSIWLGW